MNTLNFCWEKYTFFYTFPKIVSNQWDVRSLSNVYNTFNEPVCSKSKRKKIHLSFQLRSYQDIKYNVILKFLFLLVAESTNWSNCFTMIPPDLSHHPPFFIEVIRRGWFSLYLNNRKLQQTMDIMCYLMSCTLTKRGKDIKYFNCSSSTVMNRHWTEEISNPQAVGNNTHTFQPKTIPLI